MPRNKKSKIVIVEALAARENEWLKARDISEIGSRVYKHDIHPKSVSKLIPPLQDEYSNIVRVKYGETETQTYRCRYSYSWMTSGEITAVQLGIVGIF